MDRLTPRPVEVVCLGAASRIPKQLCDAALDLFGNPTIALVAVTHENVDGNTKIDGGIRPALAPGPAQPVEREPHRTIGSEIPDLAPEFGNRSEIEDAARMGRDDG